MKKKRIIIGILVLVGAFVVFGMLGKQPEPETTTDEKKAFFVTTAPFGELVQTYTITKWGTVLGANDITVTSQVAGRVNSIAATIGQELSGGTTVISLTDSAGAATFNAQQAQASLNQAKINYEQTLLSLDKAIVDTELALQQAQYNANLADQGIYNSNATLQLQQLEQELTKAQIDYQKQLDSDEQTIENYIQTSQNYADDLWVIYQDILREIDSILGVSQEYTYANDDFETNLGAKNSATRHNAEMQMRVFLTQESKVRTLSEMNVSESDLGSFLYDLKQEADKFLTLLDKVEMMLNFTSTSNNLTSTELDAFFTTVNTLQSTTQTKISAITTQRNTVNSFLSTYLDTQASLAQALDITKQNIAVSKNNLASTDFTSTISVGTTQAAYTTAQKNKQTTLQSLQNAITQAQISYNQASNELGKFSVETPIDGIIGDIFVDVGQEVNPGASLFTVSSNNMQQIEISLGSQERDLVEQGQDVRVIYNETILPARLVSITKTADSNFTYKAIIELDETIELLGNLVQVEIPTSKVTKLLPLNYITIINTTTGLVPIWDGEQIRELEVQLGKIRGKNIEITSEILDTTQIITSNISNFNELDYYIEIKETE